MSSDVIDLFKRRLRSGCKGGIYHQGPFIYGDDDAFIECEACKALLTPMAVLKIALGQDSRLLRRIAESKAHLAKIENKLRTKCENCGKMTRINK